MQKFICLLFFILVGTVLAKFFPTWAFMIGWVSFALFDMVTGGIGKLFDGSKQ